MTTGSSASAASTQTEGSREISDIAAAGQRSGPGGGPAGALRPPAPPARPARRAAGGRGRIAPVAGARAGGGGEGPRPRLDAPPYRSSVLRHPTKDLHHADPDTIELSAPCF